MWQRTARAGGDDKLHGDLFTTADNNALYVTNTATASGNGITSNPTQATVTSAQTPGITVAKSALPTTYSTAPTTITHT